MTTSWGLFGGDKLPSGRRSRDLNLKTVVGYFNELAVPGLGNVWFGKQLFLSLLGLAVGDRIHSIGKFTTNDYTNIKIANAIEALACWCAVTDNPVTESGRVRGTQKIAKWNARKNEKYFPSYKDALRSEFYVKITMRMYTTHALPSLGFVETGTSRFNDYCLTDLGINILESCENCWNKKTIVDLLELWVKDDWPKIKSDKNFRRAIRPDVPLSDKIKKLLLTGFLNNPRRAAIKQLCECKNKITLGDKPSFLTIMDDDHWQDIHMGARFFLTRDKAISILDGLEKTMEKGEKLNLEDAIERIKKNEQDAFDILATRAKAFKNCIKYLPDAQSFCNECQQNPIDVLRSLLLRDADNLVLTSNNVIIAGPKFLGTKLAQVINKEDEEREEAPAQNAANLPEGISHWIYNAESLVGDLK